MREDKAERLMNKFLKKTKTCLIKHPFAIKK